MAFRFPTNLFFRSFCVGVVAAVVLGALAFVLAPFFDAVRLYTSPAALLVPVLVPIIPSRLMHWLVPDGGAPAAILLIMASAILFWSILLGAAYFGFVVSKHSRARPDTDS